MTHAHPGFLILILVEVVVVEDVVAAMEDVDVKAEIVGGGQGRGSQAAPYALA